MRPALVADAREVAELLTVPVSHFLPGAPIEMVEEERDGWSLRYGAFPVAGHHVWGATGACSVSWARCSAGPGHYQGSPSDCIVLVGLDDAVCERTHGRAGWPLASLSCRRS